MLSDLGELPAIKLTDTDYLRFELDSLSPYGHEVAAKELRESPETKQKAMEELKKMLQGWDVCRNFIVNHWNIFQ